MKPQDSQDALPHSPQIPEGASTPEPEGASATEPEGARADAAFENLATHLEQLNIEKINYTPFNRAELKDIIAGLEQHNADGSWIKNYYDILDLYMMPALVDQANRKYPEMNLKLTSPPNGFALALKDTLENGIKSSRFIVNAQDRGIHFAVVDHQTIGDQISLIFFESTSLRDTLPALLALRTRQALGYYPFPPIHFAMVEMDIQRSSSECGMFSLGLAKKLYLESQKLERLHKDNVKGVLCEPDMPLPAEKLDPYIPARLYKHLQGRRRLMEYLQSNPDAEHEKVNKKGETLVERFEKNLVKTETKMASVSQHRKRATEYKSLML
ncbi:YopJ/AvrA family T3SS effector serine/threonine acetyltransferase [Bartonella queenslandensis]|uniref:YopJ/AvrA family T3SS effector serine/threonine acetyltransferase n=1 Tax=Bartonella queenslandensis TaxID=481138 RepID=UPI001BA91E7B|nr:YopJ/AvrA family T3SS effector serine/threonine acetyltransferase [Bartonella queenslandensis]